MTLFAQQQVELRALAKSVGFEASLRNLTSPISMEYALIEEQNRDQEKTDTWLAIAAILESRGR